MRCLFLYNPASGKGRVQKRLPAVVNALERRFGKTDAAASRGPGDMERLAREACGKYDVLAFAGGDGTFHEVLNGVGGAENRPLLAYLPAGTANDVARSCGIPRNIRRAVKNIEKGTPVSADVMRVCGKDYAAYEVSAGMFTPCSYSAKRSEKKYLGRLAYVLEMLRHEMKFASFPVRAEADGKVYETECFFALLLNSRSVGGMPVNGGAALNDGKANLLLIRGVKKAKRTYKCRAFMKLIRFLTLGYRSAKGADYVTVRAARFIVDAPENVVWNFDGEKGVSGRIEAEILKEHIRLLVPVKSAKSRRFSGGEEN